MLETGIHYQYAFQPVFREVVFEKPSCTPLIPQPSVSTTTVQPLTGKVTRADVQAAAGWETLRGENYSPDSNLVKVIQGSAGDVNVLLFLGTWCGESKREVPRFFLGCIVETPKDSLEANIASILTKES